jgi:hypothetical protein
MSAHIILQAVVVLVVVYLLYRGAVNAPTQITPKTDPQLQLTFVPTGGMSTAIKFSNLTVLRGEPIFDIWNPEYVLAVLDNSCSVVMYEDGTEPSEGTVVGWLVEISTKRYTN